MTVVHFHGGGYCVGSARTARSWAAHLSAAAGCRVVLPEYRLAPEHPHPAALADARAVVGALAADVAPGSLVLSGDSAGGGLALALLLAQRDDGGPPAAGWHPAVALARPRPRPPGRSRPGPPGRAAEPGLARRLRARLRRGGCAVGQRDIAAARGARRAAAAAHPGRDRRAARAGRRAAGRERGGGQGRRDVHQWPRMWHDFALQPGLLAAADSAVAQAAWFVGKVTGGQERAA